MYVERDTFIPYLYLSILMQKARDSNQVTKSNMSGFFLLQTKNSDFS